MPRLYSFYQLRVRFISALFFICSIAILGKMLYVQSFQAADLREITLNAGFTERSVKGSRGNISDRNGQILAETIKTYTFWVNTQKEADVNAIATLFSEAFNQPLDSYQKLLLPTRIHPVDGTLMVLVNPQAQRSYQLKTPMGTPTHSNNTADTSPKIRRFYIDHTEVTVEQYKNLHPDYDETYVTGKKGCPSCPAMGINWNEAHQHCISAGKRLPMEEEWEIAAQGPSKRSLPWGDKTAPHRANLVGEEDGFLSVAPVGSFPLGAGPYGAMDMIGNVWEWVDSVHSSLFKDPEPKKNKTKTLRIAKGGSWASQNQLATISYRNVADGEMKNPTFGFRCVKTVE